MTRPVSDIAFTPTVKALQVQHGSREAYARMEREQGWKQTITPELAAFIAERDSLYLGTANAAGQPYIQRGGQTVSQPQSRHSRAVGKKYPGPYHQC